MTDFIYEDAFEPDVNIKVIGVGGGGGNALNCMVASGVQDIEYIAINTDAKALNNSKATTRIQIGAKLTKGRGAGNKPAIGQQSAEENKEEIEAALKGADMVFITAGMGGAQERGGEPQPDRQGTGGHGYGVHHCRHGWRYGYRCSSSRCKDCTGSRHFDRCGCNKAVRI